MRFVLVYIILCLVECTILAQSVGPIPDLPKKKADHTIILVGDAGYLDNDQNTSNTTLKAVKRYSERLSESSSLIFLGDNIHPNGLPPLGAENRKHAQLILDSQLEAIRDYKGKVYFMPGNYDWNNSGKNGNDYILRQEEYVEQYFPSVPVVKYIPDLACGGPEVKEVNKNFVMMFIDSEWWLRNKKFNQSENAHCVSKTRNDLIEGLRSEFLRYRNDKIILVMHHPLQTLGAHSGTYDWREHVFPLHNIIKGFYLPLPIIGSFFTAAKNIFGPNQDISHPDYQLLKNKILELIEELKLELIVVSGHDRGLQYFKDDANHFILSGGGVKKIDLKYSDDAGFVSASSGFAVIRYYSNEEIWLDFIGSENDDSESQILFRTNLYEDNKRLRKAVDFRMFKSISQIDTVARASDRYAGGKMKKFWFGHLYRDMWSTPVKVPFLNLEEYHGGFEPLKLGGGKSTITIRLQGKDGSEYMLRSVEKYYYRALGPEFKDLKVFDLVQNMVAANCTYSALITPSLSRAAEIYYTKAQLFYVKQQPGLKGFNKHIPEGLYWLERRPSDDGPIAENFGNASKIINYMELMEELENKKTHFVDQKWVLKSRLFDMWIHDLDRHDDNWRWAAFKIDGSTMYRPIPRDRDMAFYKFEGFFPGIFSHYVSKILLPFRKNLQDVQYFNDAAINFDNSFLNQLDWEDWEPIISRLQQQLTDSVILKSFEFLPDEVQHLIDPFFFDYLTYRRDHLRQTARRYYNLLNKEIIIVGTNHKDKFMIDHLPAGKIKIQQYVHRNNKADILKYERLFDPDVTDNIRIYALGEDDDITVSGQADGKITIRVIGGHGNDVLLNKSQSDNIKLFDYPGDFTTEGDIEINETEELFVNTYIRKGNKYNETSYTADFGIAPDDGFWIGLGQIRNIESWPHIPHYIQHRYSISIAPGSRRFVHLKYKATFDDIAKSGLDLVTNVNINTPTYLNYFGLGNQTELVTKEKQFNWVRMHHYRLGTRIAREWSQGKIKLEAGPYFERRQIRNREGRITSFEEYGFIKSDFDAKNYIGFSGQLKLGYRDNSLNPMDGFELDIEGGVIQELSSDKRVRYFSVTNSSYIPILRNPQITLANRIGFSLATGDIAFYQRPNLGHSTGLRGWRHQRFTGDRAFFHNIDLRFHLFETTNRILPARVGLVTGFDYGRVWYDGESSQKMHTAYTVGLSLDILSLVILHPFFSVHSEYNRFSLKLGYSF